MMILVLLLMVWGTGIGKTGKGTGTGTGDDATRILMILTLMVLSVLTVVILIVVLTLWTLCLVLFPTAYNMWGLTSSEGDLQGIEVMVTFAIDVQCIEQTKPLFSSGAPLYAFRFLRAPLYTFR